MSDESGRVLRRFNVADWVDFSDGGDLLIGTGGCLYRLPARRVALASDDPLKGAKLVSDLRPLIFRERVTPDDARRWRAFARPSCLYVLATLTPTTYSAGFNGCR